MTFLATTRSTTLTLLALAVVCAGPAVAQQIKVGDLILDHAWARATPGGAKVGGAYLTIKNNGTAADKLIGGSSAAAAEVQDAKGTPVQSDKAFLDPSNTAELRVALKPLTPGTYKVIWRVLSVDTHRTNGSFTFRVGP